MTFCLLKNSQQLIFDKFQTSSDAWQIQLTYDIYGYHQLKANRHDFLSCYTTFVSLYVEETLSRWVNSVSCDSDVLVTRKCWERWVQDNSLKYRLFYNKHKEICYIPCLYWWNIEQQPNGSCFHGHFHRDSCCLLVVLCQQCEL